jgi:tetratricopeptide (TPR) repeat protein
VIAEHYALAGETLRAAAYREQAGDQARQLGAYQAARQAYENALRLGQRESAVSSAGIHLKLGEAYWQLGDFPAATERLKRALAQALRKGDSALQADALYYFSRVAISQGDYQQAKGQLAESLPLARQAGGETLARILYGLGDIGWRSGDDLEQAKTYTQESLELARALGDNNLELYALNRLGSIAGARDEKDTTRRLHEECLERARAVGNREREATALTNLGDGARFHHTDYAQARAFYQSALEIDQEMGQQEWVAMGLANLADVSVDMDDLAAARGYLHKGLRLARQLGALPQALLGVLVQARLLAA